MINDLVEELSKILGIMVMVFADDIAILADSRTALNKGIQTILYWCKKNRMEMNKEKSHILFIKSKPRSIKQN